MFGKGAQHVIRLWGRVLGRRVIGEYRSLAPCNGVSASIIIKSNSVVYFVIPLRDPDAGILSGFLFVELTSSMKMKRTSVSQAYLLSTSSFTPLFLFTI
jgi:hypothetical protein